MASYSKMFVGVVSCFWGSTALVSAFPYLAAFCPEGTGARQSIPFGDYRVDEAQTTRFNAILSDFKKVIEEWNERTADGIGRFGNISSTSGHASGIRRLYMAADADPRTVTRSEFDSALKKIREEIAGFKFSTGIVRIDNESWLAVAFGYDGACWNGNRFTKKERVQRNVQDIIAPHLMPVIAQAPRHGSIAGMLLHYSYAFYTGSMSTSYSFEEVQFRIPRTSISSFVSARITVEELVDSSVILVRSEGEGMPQRISLSSN